jgi:hypothetical protein
MYNHPFSIELWKTAPLGSQSLFSAPFAPSAISPHLGLFHTKSMSPHPPLSHPITPDSLHPKRPTKAQILAPFVFLLCPSSLCLAQTLLDSPSIHTTYYGQANGPGASPQIHPKTANDSTRILAEITATCRISLASLCTLTSYTSYVAKAVSGCRCPLHSAAPGN